MKPFQLGHSTEPDWHGAIDDCLAQTGPADGANLGVLYVTDPHAAELGSVLRELKKQTGIEHWIGSTASAVLCTRHEYYDQAAMVILLCEFAADSFSIFNNAEHSHHKRDVDPMAGLRFAVVHADPRNSQLTELIEQLPEQLGNGYLVGGLTSAEQYFYQIADEIVEGQISGVVFEDNVPVLTGLSQGCSPIGPTHTLTECDHHMAMTIDGRPALEVFKEDIGEILAKDIDRAAGYIFAGFPVTGSDTGDYLVRNIIGIDPENQLLAIGDHMKENSPIMFCRRDGKTAVEDMTAMLEKLKNRLGDARPRGGIYISCLGRGRNLFGDNNEEMAMIAEVFGDLPIAGFYANGEIAGNRLYGYTGVLTLFL